MFGKTLQTRREALGLSQTALAERVGTSAATINRLERGKRDPRKLRVEIICSLAAALDMPTGELAYQACRSSIRPPA